MDCCFKAGNILLPKDADFEKWAVIAVDQFTSDSAYWNRVEAHVQGVPSTLQMVLPEIYLETEASGRIASISKTMNNYIAAEVFAEYPNAFIYVERTLLNGMIRPGIVGVVDLEQYHYDPAVNPAIGATEQTILERVPPRIAVRREAALEFPHVILFCNDFESRIVRPVAEKKEQLKKLYEFDLMEDGGHIAGWLVDGKYAEDLQAALLVYQKNAEGTAFLVADGNHSLVTAKCWYEELKQKNPDKDLFNHPARYALVELENILDDSIDFEPIHRVIFETDTEKLLADLKVHSCPEGSKIECIVGNECRIVNITVPAGELPVAVLQRFLDGWLAENAGKIDYVHDRDAAEQFARTENTVSILLPVFDKAELFAFGAAGKILPRKTFSLGHGREKRYYLEGRKIR